MSQYGGDLAVIIEAWGCIDTSYCEDMCFLGTSNYMLDQKKKVEKIIDLSGKETEDQPNELLVYIYADGTTRKVFKTE